MIPQPPNVEVIWSARELSFTHADTTQTGRELAYKTDSHRRREETPF